MTDDSYANLPATVTVETGKLIEQLKAFDEANAADRLSIAELESSIAAREAAAAPLRLILGIAAPMPEDPSVRQMTTGKVSLARPPKEPKRTHRYVTLKLLSQVDRPMRAIDVINQALETYGMTIQRTSLSPVLAKLLAAEMVEHDKKDARWRITDKGRQELAEIEEAAR